jgi:two-component system response regulator FlrC
VPKPPGSHRRRERAEHAPALDRARGASEGAADRFLTRNPEMHAVLELARRVAGSDATVLIEGESGTGKELLARLVHRNSRRRVRALVALNCAALPAGLLESELFGHEKGAFTGALERVNGKFELADGTTLLLDEIGELELGLQAKLLRVIQEKQVQPIGASLPLDLDFRVVATTSRDLAAETQAGRFREDLYYRLNVVPIRISPLRRRPEDIRFLGERFLERHARAGRRIPRLSEDAWRALVRYRWPGNVRELQNLIERLVLVMAGRTVGPEQLWPPGSSLAAGDPRNPAQQDQRIRHPRARHAPSARWPGWPRSPEKSGAFRGQLHPKLKTPSGRPKSFVERARAVSAMGLRRRAGRGAELDPCG